MRKLLLLLITSLAFMQDYSLEFDGIDDYVEFSPTGLNILNNNHSISAWLYAMPVTDNYNTQFILLWGAPGAGSHHWIVSNDSFHLGRWNQGATSSDPIFEQWIYVTVTYDGNTTRSYVDGELVDELELEENNEYLLTNNFFISYLHDGDHWEGKMSELILFNRTLTQEEIQDNMLAGLVEQEDIIGHWKFNEGSGNTLYDHSGNQNDGTINGATWVENIEGCTDELACNYDEAANIDNGSCDDYVELWGECYNIEETTELNLYSSGFTGEIPIEIGNLVNLIELNLWDNELSGIIPNEIFTLTNLRVLNLGRNNLSGEIPSEIENLINLESLHLGGNELTGEIPLEISTLSNLYWLDLHSNQLTETIPLEIFDLDLHRLYLGNNNLTGEIPSEIGALVNLGELGLGNNNFTGEIPPEIGNLINLHGWISLNGNQLTGSIPSEIANLTDAHGFYLCCNQLTGSIPSELGNLTNLKILQLDENQLSGSIPQEIGSMESLEFIGLSINQLSGEIPEEIGNLMNLKELYLNVNQLSGEIPSTIENLINLDILYVNDNQLTGAIPASICDLPELGNDGYPYYLQFHDNNFCLPYPVCLTEEQLGTQNTSECMYNYSIDLHSNANLISFMSLPEDNSVENVMESLNTSIVSVIGEGIASMQIPTGDWVGSLIDIYDDMAYWLIMSEPATLTLSSPIFPGTNNPNYTLQQGANLVSFPYDGVFAISDVLPDDIEPYISSIVGEGAASIQNPTLGWIGSLTNLEGSKGYWFIVTEQIEFQFIDPELGQSSSQKTKKIK